MIKTAQDHMITPICVQPLLVTAVIDSTCRSLSTQSFTARWWGGGILKWDVVVALTSQHISLSQAAQFSLSSYSVSVNRSRNPLFKRGYNI